jgi:hypothetical protein
MNTEFLTILSILVISLIMGLIYYLIIRKRKKGEYKGDRVILEDLRDTFEKQIYALNDRLIQNEERWQDVNHLLYKKEYLEKPFVISKNIQYSEFLKSNGILANELNVDDRLVFVLTPFNNLFYDEYMVIKETCSKMGFNCIRGDEKEFKGDIFPKMLRYMVQARIIIANINGRNPNVLYELGVAQALDKHVILVAKEPKDLPIDIQSQRFLIYSDSNVLTSLLKAELEKIQFKSE